MALFRALRTCGVVNVNANSAFSSKVPETFATSRSISLSFAALKPDADCSWWAMKVHEGNCFHYIPVSSTLKIRSGE
jgi:hypothetical protein